MNEGRGAGDLPWLDLAAVDNTQSQFTPFWGDCVSFPRD
jgi:hypothetical protein